MLQFELNGQSLHPPVEWTDLSIEASFNEDEIQANITIDQFTFVNQSNKEIREWIDNGLSNGVGIFEGIPFTITISNSTASRRVFNGHLDLTKGLKIINPVKLSVGIEKDKGSENLKEKMQANSFAYIESKNGISSSDYFNVDYVVEKEFNAIELSIIALTTYTMVKSTTESINNIQLASARLTAALTPLPAVPTPAINVGGIIYALLAIALQLIFFILLIIAIKNLFTQLISNLISPIKTYKGAKIKTLLEKAFLFLGYNFHTNISELDNLVYLPSRPTQNDSISKGIPRAEDVGYTIDEMVELCKKMFNANIKIDELANVYLHSKSDPFWQLNSQYVMGDCLVEDFEYNTADLVANKLYSFKIDLQDEWTTRNWEGTNYEVITEPVNILSKDRVKIKGLESVEFGVALGNRKDGLNNVESALKVLAGIADALTGILGGGSNFVSKINSRVGMLKVSSNVHSVPKILYYNGSKIDANHRSLFKAKTLYDNYHIYDSFVNNWNGQKLIYSNVKVPFDFSDFLKTIDNSYFTTFDGKIGKFMNIRWLVEKDQAECDFWVREIYTRNLREIKVEPK